MLFITDDGVRLYYLDEGQGQPVLLLHAFPLNADSFRPQIAALSGRYRFIVPDHRGFGRSGIGDIPPIRTERPEHDGRQDECPCCRDVTLLDHVALALAPGRLEEAGGLEGADVIVHPLPGKGEPPRQL